MLRVLLVDDDLTMLKILEQKVPWADYSCQVMGTAMDGEQALALVHRELPDLVVTDIKMPVMGGLDFCRALQCDRLSAQAAQRTEHSAAVLHFARAAAQP